MTIICNKQTRKNSRSNKHSLPSGGYWNRKWYITNTWRTKPSARTKKIVFCRVLFLNWLRFVSYHLGQYSPCGCCTWLHGSMVLAWDKRTKIRIPCHARIKLMKLMKKKHWKTHGPSNERRQKYVTWSCMHTMSIPNQPTKESYKQSIPPNNLTKIYVDHRQPRNDTVCMNLYRRNIQSNNRYTLRGHTVPYALEDYRLLRCYFLGERRTKWWNVLAHIQQSFPFCWQTTFSSWICHQHQQTNLSDG